MSHGPVVVVGAGPAGAAVAIGLARHGEDVVVVAKPRLFSAVEGVPDRVIGALRGLGLRHALRALEPPSARRAIWSGLSNDANRESLVDRVQFDRGLLQDMEASSIRVLQGQVLKIDSRPGRHQVQFEGMQGRGTLEAGFLVEARGRWAPGRGLPRVRGPETVSLLQHWKGASGDGGASSFVQSLEDGWAWMAALPDGRRYLQLTLDARGDALPARRDMADYCRARFATLAASRPFTSRAQPMGQPYARASTPVLNEAVAGDDWIRVGDAAMAVDPLSGNGIFQALSSALQAPAVVATLRHDPGRAALAQRFHAQRIAHLFYRFARTGRDFYAMEARWPQSPFWAVRRSWPDREPLHAEVTPAQVDVARRPVVRDGRIVEADVVVTPDQPLGIWHLDGLPLAPLLRAVRAAPPGASPEQELAAQCGLSPARAAQVVGWMRAQKWVA